MDRVSSAGYTIINSIRCWINKNLGSGIQGTTFDQVWFQGVQESIVETIAASGQAPADSAVGSPDTQLLDAILAFGAANTQLISSTPGSPLSAINAGLAVVNATSGNISITLPASAGLGGQVQRWKFVRTDATSNTVSISFHAGDTTLIGALSGPLSLGPQSQLDLSGDGTTHWHPSSSAMFGGFNQDTGTANAMAITLSPAPASLSAIIGVPLLVIKGASASNSALTISVNGLTATAQVRADGTAFSSTVVWPANAYGIVVYNGASFSVLTDPAPSLLAPLASPAFTGVPTVPTAAVGTSTTQAASTAMVQAALPTAWSNVTGSRSVGTVYTNSTGKPISVSVWGVASGTSNLEGFVNGSQVATNTLAQNSGNTYGIYFQVPEGATYEVSSTGSFGSLSAWWELS